MLSSTGLIMLFRGLMGYHDIKVGREKTMKIMIDVKKRKM